MRDKGFIDNSTDFKDSYKSNNSNIGIITNVKPNNMSFV
jgi:hypothetical protein